MDFLLQEAIIGDGDMAALQMTINNPQQQCRELMTLLHTSDHPQAFIQLYAAIKEESHLQWLAERIDKFSYQSGDLLHIIATFDQGRSQEIGIGSDDLLPKEAGLSIRVSVMLIHPPYEGLYSALLSDCHVQWRKLDRKKVGNSFPSSPPLPSPPLRSLPLRSRPLSPP